MADPAFWPQRLILYRGRRILLCCNVHVIIYSIRLFIYLGIWFFLTAFLWCVSDSFIFFLAVLQKDEVYLNLVLDYVPETVYRVSRHYSRAKQILPMIYVKVLYWRALVKHCQFCYTQTVHSKATLKDLRVMMVHIHYYKRLLCAANVDKPVTHACIDLSLLAPLG